MEFTLRDEYIELIKLLKTTKIAQTGGHARILVESGEVSVNKHVELRKRAKIRKGDVVTVEGHKVTVV
ncbi:MAG: RNA-binding S4 domain-containing protein [Bacteroidota bacterium]